MLTLRHTMAAAFLYSADQVRRKEIGTTWQLGIGMHVPFFFLLFLRDASLRVFTKKGWNVHAWSKLHSSSSSPSPLSVASTSANVCTSQQCSHRAENLSAISRQIRIHVMIDSQSYRNDHPGGTETWKPTDQHLQHHDELRRRDYQMIPVGVRMYRNYSECKIPEMIRNARDVS